MPTIRLSELPFSSDNNFRIFWNNRDFLDFFEIDLLRSTIKTQSLIQQVQRGKCKKKNIFVEPSRETHAVIRYRYNIREP